MDSKIKLEYDHTDENVRLSEWLPVAIIALLMGLGFVGLTIVCLRQGFLFQIPTVVCALAAVVLILFAALVGNSATTKDRW